MIVFIVRHGETQANIDGVFQGRTDSPLLASGLALPVQTGQALQGVSFDAAFSSPLSRAKETARIILDESRNGLVAIEEDDRIAEVSMGEYEGLRFRPGECEVDAALSRRFFDNPLLFDGFPGGESAREVMERTRSFVDDLAAKDYGTVLVSTHGFALRAMLNPLYDDPSDFWQGAVPLNCSLSIAVLDPAGSRRLVASDIVLYQNYLCIDRFANH